VTSAARSSSGSLVSDAWNACVSPWNGRQCRRGMFRSCLAWLMAVDRVAERNARREVEGKGDDRKLALMIDR
jgi:hypothetical protein